MTALDVFWVGLGGGLGSLLRWWIGLRVGQFYKGPFPLGTFLINVSGAFVIGYLSILFTVDWRDRYGDNALPADTLRQHQNQLLHYVDTLERWLTSPPAGSPLFLPLLLSPQRLARFARSLTESE